MIVSMKRMTLIALCCDEDKIMRAMQRLSAVEVIPPDDNEKDLNAELFASYENRLKALEVVVDRLKPYADKPGLLTPLPEVDIKALDDESTFERAEAIKLRVNEISEKISEINASISQKKQLLSGLMPWKRLETPIEKLKGTKHTLLKYGFVSNEGKTKLLNENIAVDFIECDTQEVPCVIYVHKDDEEALKIVEEAEFSECVLPDLKGTVAENIERLNDECKIAEAELSAENKKLEELGKDRQAVLLALDAINVEYDRLKVMADVLKSKSTFIIDAWVRSDETETVENEIKRITDAYFMQLCDPKEDEKPPTVVRNTKFTSPFEAVVNMYSRPSYKGIDATSLMAPFYMLFFGMMLGDTGYGLLLFLGTWLFEKIKKPSGNMKGLVGTLKWSGLATMVCGVLFGSFFGIDFDVLLGTKDVFPLIMDPMTDVMGMLILCCGLGIIHMIYGLGIKIYMCLKQGDVPSAIFDNLSWILILIGAVGAVAAPSPYNMPFLISAILGIMLIIVFGGRNKKGLMRIFGGFGSIYNVTSYLSDTVSYARVFAIGLVGGAMGQVFNQIGDMVGSAGNGVAHIILVLLEIVILVVLHLFSLFINTLSAFAHTARLQYVEFFGKFYEAGGREFKPLGINAKSVRVKNK